MRWVARIGSLVSLGFIAAFVAGSIRNGETPSMTEAVALGFFPGGIAIGFVIGWFSEGVGGGIVILSLAAFYGWMYDLDHRFPKGPYFLLVALPGLLFLITWLLDQYTDRFHLSMSTKRRA